MSIGGPHEVLPPHGSRTGSEPHGAQASPRRATRGEFCCPGARPEPIQPLVAPNGCVRNECPHRGVGGRGRAGGEVLVDRVSAVLPHYSSTASLTVSGLGPNLPLGREAEMLIDVQLVLWSLRRAARARGDLPLSTAVDLRRSLMTLPIGSAS